MWDLLGPGLEPVSPALAGRFLTTAPPGKSQNVLYFMKWAWEVGCFVFEFYFIYFLIQQVLISYLFYTYWCIYVNPNLPIQVGCFLMSFCFFFFFGWFMKSKRLGTISLYYPNKQNYSNKLISQSSAFTPNPASVCSLHCGQNDQTKTNLILLHLCLKYSPCSCVLKLADKVLTSSHATPPCTQHSNRVLWWLTVTPRLLHRSGHPLPHLPFPK